MKGATNFSFTSLRRRSSIEGDLFNDKRSLGTVSPSSRIKNQKPAHLRYVRGVEET